ncbi:hypothetical protein J3R83DRAFT_7746 [Lanmaoa asiatica]|nr:hypothetical protein J3R83DRAFT_7746 [Lanmaoa asiatica]
MNAGLNLNQYKTIVSFGDSYTDGARHGGGPLAPAVVTPPNTEAGGRSTNGPVWVEADGDRLPQAAQDLLGKISPLSNSPGTNAKNFLVTDVYGRGTQDDWGQAWIQSIYDGLGKFRAQSPPLNVVFVNFATIWDGVLGPDPGYRAFGYTNTSACVGTSICDDPEHYFYWIPGHPSKETHRIMADYIEEVLFQCRVA